MTNSTWNDERVNLLKQMWGAGKTAADIAAQLGGGITRNAVIGKAHRLGLSGGRTVQVAKKIEKVSPNPAPMITEVIVTRSPTGVGMLELTEKTCRWPLGDPKKSGFHFCGGRALPGIPYCSGHAAVAYQGTIRRLSIKGNESEHTAADALDELDNALSA